MDHLAVLRRFTDRQEQRRQRRIIVGKDAAVASVFVHHHVQAFSRIGGVVLRISGRIWKNGMMLAQCSRYGRITARYFHTPLCV